MPQQTINNGDSGLSARTKINSNFIEVYTDKHTHANKVELDKVTDGDHDVRTDNPHAVTKSQVGLANVPDLDATNPVNIVQTSSYRFVSDIEKGVWNGKQDSLGFTPEDSGNKRSTFQLTPDDIHYPTEKLVKDSLDGKQAVGSYEPANVNIQNHISSTSNPHSVTQTQVGLSNVTNDSQLKRAAGDINSFTEKTSLVDNDLFLIEDSADSNSKKKIKKSTLNTAIGLPANFNWYMMY